MGVSKDNVGRWDQTYCKYGLNNSNKRFGWEWKVLFLACCLLGALRGMLTSRNTSSGQAWNRALLKFIVATTVTPNERQHFDERSFFGDCLSPPLSIRKHSLGNDKEFKEWPKPILVDRSQLSLVIILKRVNKTRNYQSMSKDNDKIE